MRDFIIIGSGFSSLVSYLFLKKYKIEVISSNNMINNSNDLFYRKNLNTNKLLSEKKGLEIFPLFID